MEHTAVAETNASGSFARTDSVHRHCIGDASYPPVAGRYLLVCAYACPWAHRCLIVRALLGLEAALPLTTVHPTWQRTSPNTDNHSGWVFRKPTDPPVLHPSQKTHVKCDNDCIPPPPQYQDRWTSVRSIYETSASSGATSPKDIKFTVPLLYDMHTNAIVNNESSEIMRMLADPRLLGQFATKNTALVLRPTPLLACIEQTNQWVYTQINNGVYKCGFATSQDAYNTAADDLEAGLVRANQLLAQSKYLCSQESFTEADIRLFVTLIRHDEVYCVYFKTNHCPVVGSDRFPHLVRYLKDLLSVPEIRATVKMKHIKWHYYTSHPSLNVYGIVPKGRDVLRSLL